VQRSVRLLAATLVTLNLVVDLTYAWLDPRIRYS
jgi:ABC-type dipeptide/oligopeptide/nickel transport system permease component